MANRERLNTPTLCRNNVVRVGVCSAHPRAGRDVDVTKRRVRIECNRCFRLLVLIRGPFINVLASR